MSNSVHVTERVRPHWTPDRAEVLAEPSAVIGLLGWPAEAPSERRYQLVWMDSGDPYDSDGKGGSASLRLGEAVRQAARANWLHSGWTSVSAAQPPLSYRAVVADSWRWVEHQLTTDGDRLLPRADPHHAPQLRQIIARHALPDLEDAPTLAGLEATVRAAWEDPDLVIQDGAGRWGFAAYQGGATNVHGGFSIRTILYASSRAELLVVALETSAPRAMDATGACP